MTSIARNAFFALRHAGLALSLLGGAALVPAQADTALRSGEQVYRQACVSCHGAGPVDAPKLGDRAAWGELIAEGQAVVTAHGWVGVREMPARGGEPGLKLEEFGRAVAYMARAAGADWADPAADAALMARIRDEETARIAALKAAAFEAADAGRDGATVYQAICSHCHQSGVADAPRFAEAGDWAELIAEGQAVVTAHGWVGVRAMPARGGHAELSLDEFGRAVAHMAAAAGGTWPDPSLDPEMMGRIRVEIADRRRELGLD